MKFQGSVESKCRSGAAQCGRSFKWMLSKALIILYASILVVRTLFLGRPIVGNPKYEPSVAFSDCAVPATGRLASNFGCRPYTNHCRITIGTCRSLGVAVIRATRAAILLGRPRLH